MEEKYKMQIACSQVDMILNFYNQELLDMTIPKAVREYIRNNKAQDYQFDITPKNFYPEMITEEAACILLWLFKEYSSTKKQKKIILNWEYPNNVDTSSANDYLKETKNTNNNANNKMLPMKDVNIFVKLINKIKLIFRRLDKTNE